MRNIGSVPTEKDARRFSHYLISRGIPNDAEPGKSGEWAIWVHEDSQLAEGEEELARYLANPSDPIYDEGAKRGQTRIAEERKDAARARSRVIDVRTHWSIAPEDLGFTTMLLMAISILVTICEHVPEAPKLITWFSITEYHYATGYMPGLPEIRHGQIWRLVTPIFLHFGILHILFNMMWLKQLGSAIESTEGTVNFVLQVLLYAITGNLTQYVMTGPNFGGMSGVVYGLFGFTWMCEKYDPARRYSLGRDTVVWMVIWFFLCMTGWLGPIANYAHAAGLICGMLWGAITVRRVPFTPIRF